MTTENRAPRPDDPRPDSGDSAVDPAAVRLVVLGAGNMGGAFVRAARAAGVPADGIRIVNSREASSRRAAEELDATAGTLADIAEADLLVIGIKPYQLAAVLPTVREHLQDSTLVVSLAAGATLASLAEVLDGHRRLARAMPNIPMSVGEGVTQVVAGPELEDSDLDVLRAVLSASGLVIELPEDKVHAVIGAAGSAVAFVFTVVDAMVDEAVREGIPRADAQRIVVQTVKGAAQLLETTGEHPAVARGNVMSPGGTTAEGVAALERHGLRPALAAAMDAAATRSREMAGE